MGWNRQQANDRAWTWCWRAAVCALWAAACLQAQAQSDKPGAAVAETVLQALAVGKPAEVLVVLDDSPEQAAETASGLATEPLHRMAAAPYGQRLALRQALLDGLKNTVLATALAADAQLLTHYSHLPLLHLRLASPAALARLQAHARVLRVDEVRVARLSLAQSLPLVRQPDALGAGFGGGGTTVAVLDTGVDYRDPAFGSCTTPGGACKVVAALDFTPFNDGQLDDDGHGTNVAGIVLGVAPGARIAALDVFRGDGFAYDSDIIAAINWSVANKAVYNIAAINMSLGGGRHFGALAPNDSFGIAAQSAVNAGIVVVAASGNNGYLDSMNWPGAYANVVSVGAYYDAVLGGRFYQGCSDFSTQAFQMTCFSNSASFLTLVAPGATISAAGHSMSGTSQAAPHVAGAAAVLRAAYPGDTVASLVNRLRQAPLLQDHRNGVSKPSLDLPAALNLPTNEFRFASATYVVGEGGGSVTLTVTRSVTRGSARVSYATVAGSAAVRSDFTARSGVLNFADGVASAGIVIPIVDDGVAEPPETFSVTLSSPSPGAVGSPASATVTIDDDDVPVFVGFASASYAVSETAPSLTIPVLRNSGNGTARVKFTVNAGTAAAGRDYKTKSGTLRFARGATSANLVLKLANDREAEAVETLTITLSAPTGMALGPISTATVAIIDDESPPGPMRLSVYRQGEGQVLSQPAGIHCGPGSFACNATVTAGNSLTLNATAAPGWAFAGWQGGCTGASPSCTLLITAATAVTALFGTDNGLAHAVDSALPLWSTGGSTPWAPQTAQWVRGGSALKSGTLADRQSNLVQTQVTGPGLLSFTWRVSSEAGWDFVRFGFDGWTQVQMSGESSWIEQSWFVPEGSHVLSWTYAKDGSLSHGADSAWLDDVRFTPGSSFSRAAGVRTLVTGPAAAPVRQVFGTVAPKN